MYICMYCLIVLGIFPEYLLVYSDSQEAIKFLMKVVTIYALLLIINTEVISDYMECLIPGLNIDYDMTISTFNGLPNIT